MHCRKCKEKMKEIPVGFDTLSMLYAEPQMYCNNKDCEHFGFVTIAGIKAEDLLSTPQE